MGISEHSEARPVYLLCETSLPTPHPPYRPAIVG